MSSPQPSKYAPRTNPVQAKPKASQSLFLVDYLGKKPVSESCSDATIPWVIEELRFKKRGKSSCWFTPGLDHFALVKESGEQQLECPHGSILRCCLGTGDGCSFAVVVRLGEARRRKDGGGVQSLCHAFETANAQDAASLVQTLNAHTSFSRTPESARRFLLLHSSSPLSKSPSADEGLNRSGTPSSFSSQLSDSLPSRIPLSPLLHSAGSESQVNEFTLQYGGSVRVLSPSVARIYLDEVLMKLRQAQQTAQKLRRGSGGGGGGGGGEGSPGDGGGESVQRDGEGKGGGREGTDIGGRPSPPAGAVAGLLVNNSYSSTDALADSDGSQVMTGGRSAPDLLKDGNESETDSNASGKMVKEERGGGEEEVQEGGERVQEGGERVQEGEEKGQGGYEEGQGGEEERQEGEEEGQGGDEEGQGGDEEGQEGEEEGQGGDEEGHGGDEEGQGEEEEELKEEEKADSSVTAKMLGTLPCTSQPAAAPPLSQTLPSVSVTSNSPTGMEEPTTISLTQQQEHNEPVSSLLPSSVPGEQLSFHEGIHYQTVLLGIDTQFVCVTSQVCGKVVLERLITSIACCVQGRSQTDHFGFVTKEMQGEGSERPCYCHVFKAESHEKAYSILKTFKTTFSRALKKKTLPDNLCSSCPLLQLHILCKDLEGQGKTIAQQQARVQEALSTLTDKDYNNLMKQFKSQSLGSSDREELVELVALYRQHLEAQQANHTHTADDDESAGSGEKFEEKGKLKPLGRLGRARQSLASSLESIRSKVQKKGPRASDGRGLQRQQALSPTPTPLSAKLSSDSTDIPPAASLGTTSGRDCSSSMPINSIDARLPWQNEEDRRMTTGSCPPYPIDINGSVKSVGLPSFDTLESGTGQIRRQNGLGSLSSSIQSSSTVNSSFSEPTSPVMRTPPSLKHRRQLSLTPPTTTGRKLSSNSLSAYITPVKPRSWRQIAYEGATPQRGMGRDTSIPELASISKPEPSPLALKKVGELDSPKTRARKRWKVLVEQQIMLNKMERLNSNYKKEAQKAEMKRKKLSYYDPTILVMEAQVRWDQLMAAEQVTHEELQMSLFQGVSPHKRGDVWAFLVKQKLSSLQQLQEGETASDGPTLPEYEKIKDGPTEYQQVITLDLGRTFPSHPYFTETFQDGQRELYNVLHAYSVADPEVGYCQGMSYIAGIFLIHSQEETQAFKLLWHYMNEYGFRDHYKHDMFILHVRMYQLMALLHEYLPTLHAHLEKHTVSAYLIAASWFLTMFSSQYPFAFVSRVMDLVLFEGQEAFFKVSLALLTLHEDSLLQCDSMESISEYIKEDIPDTALDHLPYILSYSLKVSPEFSLKLKGFEAEYHVLHNLSSSPGKGEGSLEETVEEVKKQNRELIEVVAALRGAITRLEAQVQLQQEKESRQDKLIETLTKRVEVLEQQARVDPPNLQLV